MIVRHWERCLVLILVGGLAAASRASVVFDNFNYNNDQNKLFDYSTGTLIGNSQQAAFQFAAADTGRLSQITLAVSNFVVMGDPIPTGSWVDVALYSDGGNAVGARLGDWHVAVPVADKFLTVFDPESVSTPGSAIQIEKGARYWLAVLQGQTPASGWTWNWNYLGAPGNLANDSGLESISKDNGATFREPEDGIRGAFKVETSAVPEPCTVIASAAAFLMAIRRRKA